MEKNLNLKNINFFKNFNKILNLINQYIFLFSSFFHYLKGPCEVLEKIMIYKIPYIFFDLALFHEARDEIKIQRNSFNIYKSSYLVWVFNLEKLKIFFKNKNYISIKTFDCECKLGQYQ
jgi:putative methyltransferase (TIGR04325 family)